MENAGDTGATFSTENATVTNVGNDGVENFGTVTVDGQAVGQSTTEITENTVVEDNKPEQKTYTEDQLQSIIQDRLARERAKAEKAEAEAKKLAKMNATEKLQYQLQEKDNELNALRKAQEVAGMKKEATSILSEMGITANDTLLDFLVTDDADSTQTNIKAFNELVQAKADEIVQQKLKGSSPRLTNGVVNNIGGMTKAEIMSIKDDTVRQQKIRENLHLFE